MMNVEMMTDLFNTDKDLLSTYHILAPNSAEVCAERTIADLKKANAYVYTLENGEETIGYYGIEHGLSADFLTGFFIKPEYRTKERITDFWKEVEGRFNKDFYIGVYTKNTRAIEFLNKKTNEQYGSEDCVFFKVKRS